LGALQIQSAEEGSLSVGAADPTGIEMDRVASALRAIDQVAADRLAPPAALEAIRAISHAPPAPTWLFTLAAAAGAAALSVIFGSSIQSRWLSSPPAPRSVQFSDGPYRGTAQTPSFSRSPQRCSLA